MPIEPKVLVVWGQYPRWIPPVRFSPRQVTIAAHIKPGLTDQTEHNFNYFDEYKPDGWRGPGAFDLAEYCDRNGLARDFDFVIVFAEEDMGVLPANLADFRCPAILLVGDTHHFKRPISGLISYALREGIKMAAVQFAGHHLHWFKKGGIEACAWVPGLITRDAPRKPPAVREDKVVFVGHSWEYHYHRFCLLRAMRVASVPLDVKIGTREEAADDYSNSLISFNCSLNSDINIRNFEILSSGGFLLSELLPEVTGFQRMFRPGEACETYGSTEELLGKIAFYRRRPELACKIAERGNAMFRDELTADRYLSQFKRAFFADRIDESMLPPDPRCRRPAGRHWLRRLFVYEDIQELHRTQETVNVLVQPGVDWFDLDDFADLPRVRFRAAPDPAADGPQIRAGEEWDYVVGD